MKSEKRTNQYDNLAYLPISVEYCPFDGNNIVDLKDIADNIKSVMRRINIKPSVFYICAYGLLLTYYCDSYDFGDMIIYIQGAKNRVYFDFGAKTVKELLCDLQYELENAKDKVFEDGIGDEERKCAAFVIDSQYNITDHWLTCRLFAGMSECSFICPQWAAKCDNYLLSSLANHYKSILIKMLTSMDDVISQTYFTIELDQKMLDKFNSTDKSWLKGFSVFSQIDMFSKYMPEKKALICGNEFFTYEGLSHVSKQYAKYFHEIGIMQGDIICVCMEPSINTIAVIVASMRIGAVFMTMDPNGPPMRMSRMVQTAHADFICYDEGKRPNIPIIATQTIGTTIDKFIWAEKKKWTNSVENVAYIMCTSGSTGEPKMIPICMKSLNNTLLSFQKILHFDSSDSMLSVTTFTFDIFLLEVFLPLISGGVCFLAQQELCKSIKSIELLLQRNLITFMQATPAVWRLLIRSGMATHPRLTILCGGESLDETLCVELMSKCKKVWNVYGPTETTIWSTAHKVVSAKRNIIGKPIYNTKVYITNQVGCPLPIGVFGELCIAGLGLTLGYISEHAERYEGFLDVPYIEGLLYKTGDIARWLPDGTLEFMTKTNNFVKVNSQRICLEEIENSVRLYPNIKDVAVCLIKKAMVGEYLVACITTKDKGPIDISRLHEYLSQELPTYMLPSYFVYINEIPLTQNRKIDRQKVIEIVESNENFNEMDDDCFGEEYLYRMLMEAFKKNGIMLKHSKENKLFNHVLDSITVIGIIGYLEEKGIGLSYSDLYQCKTVSDLIKRVFALHISENNDCREPQVFLFTDTIQRVKLRIEEQWGKEVSIMGAYPLTPTQKNMLSHTLLYHDNMFYCSNCIRIKGYIDLYVMQQAYATLIQEIDRLRTVYFLNLEKKAVQLVLDKSNSELLFIDGLNVDDFNLESTIEQIRNRKLSTILNVPMQVTIIRSSKYDFSIILHFHHIIMDGISYERLVKRYFELCIDNKQHIGKENTFENYLTMLKWENHRKWRNRIASISNEIRKKQYERITNLEKAEIFCSTITISERLLASCYKNAELYQVSINTFLQAKLAIAFKKVYQKNYFLYDLVISGRPKSFKNAYGMFILTIPICISNWNNIRQIITQIHNEVNVINSEEEPNFKGFDCEKKMDLDVLVVFENLSFIKDIDTLLEEKMKCNIWDWDYSEVTEKSLCFYFQSMEEQTLTVRCVYRSPLIKEQDIEHLFKLLLCDLEKT